MNPLALSPSALLRSHLDETGPSAQVQEPSARAPGTTEQVRLRQAAQEFEAVFLRQMLSSLERTTKVSSQGSSIAGQGTYGSMIVDAVSNAVAKAGGLGLADLMAGALQEHQNADRQRTLGSIEPVIRSHSDRNALSEDERISAQGFRQVAVPNAEIRTSAIPIRGSLADRRIR